MKIFKDKSIIVILLIAFVLRLIGINRGLWNDEIITVNTLKNNPLTNPFYYGFTTNLPLYFYLFKVWSFNGIILNIIYLRFLGVVINLTNIYILFKVIYTKNKSFAFFTALLLAISPLQIHYSQEIRPYILTQFLITLHFLFTVKNLQKNNFIYGKKLTTLTILLLFSHYAAYLYLAVIFFIILLFKKLKLFSKANIKNLILITSVKIVVILSVVYNPKFIQSFNNTGISNPSVNISSFIEMFIRIKEVVTFYYYFGFWYYLASPIVQGVYKKIFLILFIFASLLIAYEYLKNKKINLIPQIALIMLFLVMPIGFYLEKFGFYPFGGRHIMPFSIFLYIIIAYLLAKIWSNKSIYAQIFIVVFTLLIVVTLTFHQTCSITISTAKEVDQKNSYSYCIENYLIHSGR